MDASAVADVLIYDLVTGRVVARRAGRLGDLLAVSTAPDRGAVAAPLPLPAPIERLVVTPTGIEIDWSLV